MPNGISGLNCGPEAMSCWSSLRESAHFTAQAYKARVSSSSWHSKPGRVRASNPWEGPSLGAI